MGKLTRDEKEEINTQVMPLKLKLESEINKLEDLKNKLIEEEEKIERDDFLSKYESAMKYKFDISGYKNKKELKDIVDKKVQELTKKIDEINTLLKNNQINKEEIVELKQKNNELTSYNYDLEILKDYTDKKSPLEDELEKVVDHINNKPIDEIISINFSDFISPIEQRCKNLNIDVTKSIENINVKRIYMHLNKHNIDRHKKYELKNTQELKDLLKLKLD